MRKLSTLELNRKTIGEFKEARKLPVSLLLDNIRSLHNVGSAFRTADAFLLEKIYLTGITGTPPHREIQKTALGATDSVPWEHALNPVDVVNRLKKEGYRIIAVEQTDESISLNNLSVKRGEKISLVFGNEINGVSEEVIKLADQAVEIPQSGTKHSLNISVCVGIVTWEIRRRLSL